jgi:predicted nucleic acid-binding protein
VQAILASCRSLPVHLVDEPDLHIHALQMSERYVLPLGCDPHYLALAEKLDKELWTYDRRLAMAVTRWEPFPGCVGLVKKQELSSI